MLTHPEEIRRWSPVDFDVDDLQARRLAAGTRTTVTGRLAGVPVTFEVEVHAADHDRLELVRQRPGRLRRPLRPRSRRARRGDDGLGGRPARRRDHRARGGEGRRGDARGRSAGRSDGQLDPAAESRVVALAASDASPCDSLFRLTRVLEKGCRLATVFVVVACIHARGSERGRSQAEGRRQPARRRPQRREFVPRGVNWRSFEYACAQGWGYSALDSPRAASTRTPPGRGDRELGRQHRAASRSTRTAGSATAAQLPTSSAPVAGYREAVQQLGRALTRQGIVVILDLHRPAARGQPDGQLAMPDTAPTVLDAPSRRTYRGDPR